MRNPSDDRKSVFHGIASCWRKWTRHRQNALELDNISGFELDQIAQDAGVSPETLRTMAGKWPQQPQLLPLRMAALHLDRDEIARAEPAVANDLSKLCCACTSKRRCKHDLTHDPDNPVWRDYCPNAHTLTALRAQRPARSTKIA